MSSDVLLEAFTTAHDDSEVGAARVRVLEEATHCFKSVADLAQTFGWLQRDKKRLSVALVCHIASELVDGIDLMCRRSRAYAAACLLRQLVEAEYIMFLGYNDPDRLVQWHDAEEEERRKLFTPSRMRKASNGLFADREYWTHCELGGHPHPKAKILLSGYDLKLEPLASVLPDAVHHVRRLWTSLSLLMSRLDINLAPLDLKLPSALRAWERTENPIVLAHDGISHSGSFGG